MVSTNLRGGIIYHKAMADQANRYGMYQRICVTVND